MAATTAVTASGHFIQRRPKEIIAVTARLRSFLQIYFSTKINVTLVKIFLKKLTEISLKCKCLHLSVVVSAHYCSRNCSWWLWIPARCDRSVSFENIFNIFCLWTLLLYRSRFLLLSFQTLQSLPSQIKATTQVLILSGYIDY